MTKLSRLACALTIAASTLSPQVANAFCGFYVAGSNDKLFNDATQVVLMRDGTRTVLAMQNNYKGPPEAFAMVIPVPTVLHEGDVKTLPKELFSHVDTMGAPRLVEYWEQDPCAPPPPADMPTGGAMPPPTTKSAEMKPADDLGVKIEAKFVVGEYQIVILSAKDSTGLDTWLRNEKYQIPDGAEPLLRPYVESGMKFFVAKVDPKKVQFVDGRAALSPLRFHYDSDDFTLPIRLGLANSQGVQDLIVNIVAPNQRYEVSNYPNVTIPTNLDVRDGVKDHFAQFYAALFDRTLEKHPKAVVTEYAWQATTCDPCPGPTLDPSELQTLGGDVLGGTKDKPAPYAGYDYVLTRLHARYGKDITNDLTFKQAKPIVGGREFVREQGRLEEGARPDSLNNFQARYAIRHEWSGPIRCEHPHRGLWGGPPSDVAQDPNFQATGVKPAVDTAFVARDAIQLASVVVRDVPEIDLEAGASVATPTPSGGRQPAPRAQTTKKSGCGCASSDRNELAGGALVVGAALLTRRRRQRR